MSKFKVKSDNNEPQLSGLKHALKNAQKIVKQYAKNQSLVKKLRQMRQTEGGFDFSDNCPK